MRPGFFMWCRRWHSRLRMLETKSAVSKPSHEQDACNSGYLAFKNSPATLVHRFSGLSL